MGPEKASAGENGMTKEEGNQGSNHLYLYEYCNEVETNSQQERQELKEHLNDVWARWMNRPRVDWWGCDSPEETEYDDVIRSKPQQPFLTFTERGLKARKYVGIIRFKEKTIHLLPKIFYRSGGNNSDVSFDRDVKGIFDHLLWWLSYCRRIKFPNTKSGFGSQRSDFFEILIHLFAITVRDFLSRHFYQTYENVREDFAFVKGGLDIPAYIRDNLSTGRWHRLSCIHDSFQPDNRFNRIIKYTIRLLQNASSCGENRRLLGEILFLFDEVADQPMTVLDCEAVRVNPLFVDMDVVLDYCRLFLANSVIRCDRQRLCLFAFLLPMEYVFEDFVFGFIEKHFEIPSLKRQKSDLHLAKRDSNKVFQMKHDIYLKTEEGKPLIIDTKYKKIYFRDPDSKRGDRTAGVSQGDMYQMVSYAIRRKANDVYLFYPSTIERKEDGNVEFTVEDDLCCFPKDCIARRENSGCVYPPEDKGNEIRIKIRRLPIINVSDLLSPVKEKKINSLKEYFEKPEEELKKSIETILGIHRKG